MARYLLSLLVGGVILAATPSVAAVIPGPSFHVLCIVPGRTVSQSATDCSLPGGNAASASIVSPVVELTADAKALAGQEADTMAGASLIFYFEVVGGTQFEQIPILITTNLTAQIIGDPGANGANAEITVTPQPLDPGSNVMREACEPQPGCGANSSSFNGTFDVTALADVAAEVGMQVSAGSVGLFSGGGGVALASADPSIEIDPTFLADNPGLTLEFSAGVANALPPTPEPSTLTLLAAGLAALAAVSLRREGLIRRAVHRTAPLA
jgi:hypothetical protein